MGHKSNKNRFAKYVKSKRETRDFTGPVRNAESHLTMDGEKLKYLIPLFLISVFIKRGSYQMIGQLAAKKGKKANPLEQG